MGLKKTPVPGLQLFIKMEKPIAMLFHGVDLKVLGGGEEKMGRNNAVDPIR